MTDRETILRDIETLRERIGMGLAELATPNRTPENEAEIRKQIATWFVAWGKLRSGQTDHC